MDRAYQDNATRQLALDLGYEPVVPPLRTRLRPWQYDREMYKRRNEVERLFRRLKGFRRIFTRFEKAEPPLPTLEGAAALAEPSAPMRAPARGIVRSVLPTVVRAAVIGASRRASVGTQRRAVHCTS